MSRMKDWHTTAVESNYLTAVGVKEALETGDMHEALRGIDALIDALALNNAPYGANLFAS